jgi:PPOX class probable F420-dependent enzyme
MPYHPMSPAELRAFLDGDPARPGVLATVRADGRPHAAPIWYVVDDDGSLVFNTGADTVKGRNLIREGRAAICVDDDRPPFSFAMIEGEVEIIDDLELVRASAARIGGRYMGEQRAEEFGARNGVPGELLVRLRPDRVVSAADLSE